MSSRNSVTRLYSLFHFVIALFLISGNCFANGNSPTINSNKEYLITQSNYLILYDSTSSLTIEEVSKLPESKFDFDPATFNSNIHQTLWLKLNIIVEDSIAGNWVLETFNQEADEIIVFSEKSEKKFVAIDTIGARIPFYQRNMYSRFPTFEIVLKGGKNTIYIKYKSRGYLGLNTILEPFQTYVNFANRYYFVIGGFFFILFILLLYNFLFFLSTYDKIYIYYILFVIAAGLDCLTVDQIGFGIFWPDHPEINHYAKGYFRAFFIFGIINYASYFLSVKKDFQRLYIAIWACYFLFLVNTIIGIAFPTLLNGLWLTIIFIFSMLVLLLYVTIVRLKQGNRPARVFVIGFASIFAGIVITYLFYAGWIPGNHVVYYILFYGITIDTFMFSFALSSRLRHERLAKERALEAENVARKKQINLMEENEVLLNKVNAELEEKVRERTVEIEESNKKLAAQAEIIRQLNVHLDKENWNLNKKVKELKIRKVIPENHTYLQMRELFSSEEECFMFLANFKWGKGFKCRRCGNTKESKENDFYSRRCSKCGTAESITAHTIFHKLKFPLDKAFYITYAVFTTKEKLNVSDLAREIDLNYKSCMKFKMKIDDAIEFQKKKGIKAQSWEDLIFEV